MIDPSATPLGQPRPPARPVLVIGSGGRAHALAWALSRSPRVSEVVVAPGNGGTEWPGTDGHAPARHAPLDPDAHADIARFAQALDPWVVVVGPEKPLAEGLADCLSAYGIRCFGPSAAAAQLESSKAFAKAFMQRHDIPTPAARTFQDVAAARAFILEAPAPMVVKASGLAGGKGVFVPESKTDTLNAVDALFAGALGAAGQTVVVEERCTGRELSVLGFSDGTTIHIMPPAQDHKQLGEGDTGPNTGGMGALAPAPVAGDTLRAIEAVLQHTIQAMASEQHPFVGVLYAGIMLTNQGPRILEYNCRFGDPEAQVLLPLLQTDLLDVIDACLEGTLDTTRIEWQDAAAVAVVAASAGYPGASTLGLPIQGDLSPDTDDTLVFHAGTRFRHGGLETDGGRVLAVTGLGPDLHTARARAYLGISAIHFPGKTLRGDIGFHSGLSLTYADAGVSLDAGQRIVDAIRTPLNTSQRAEVLSSIGSFGGMFSAMGLKRMHHPVLVSSTDGVGTKALLAASLERLDALGQDLVHHCVNDILAQGARPLFFLDYVAAGRLDVGQVTRIVSSIADACRENGCALIGGETAELPDVYASDGFELVGTIVGVVERSAVLDGTMLSEGDTLLGLRSTGLHTNGYALARHIIRGLDLRRYRPALRGSLADALLAPHRSYLRELNTLQRAEIPVRSVAHITGGGLLENVARVLPPHLRAQIHTSTFRADAPPIFRWLTEAGGISRVEAHRVFNMGVGMVLIVPANQSDQALRVLSDEGLATAWRIGQLVPSSPSTSHAPPVELRE